MYARVSFAWLVLALALGADRSSSAGQAQSAPEKAEEGRVRAAAQQPLEQTPRPAAAEAEFEKRWRVIKDEASSEDVRLAHCGDLIRAAKEMPEIITLLAKKGLTDPAAVARLTAMRALGGIGTPARAATAGLLPLLHDPVIDVRAQAAERLAILYQKDSPPNQLVRALVRQMRVDDNEYVRERCCAALGIIGPGAKDAIPALAEVLQDKRQPYLRPVAAWSLTEMGPVARPVEPILFRIVETERHHDQYLCTSALYALHSIGVPARVMVPKLLALLEESLGDSGPAFGTKVFAAMAAPQGQGMMLALTTTGRNKLELYELRSCAAGGLGFYGPEAKVAVPALIRTLDVGDVDQERWAQQIRYSALRSLERLGTDACAARTAVEQVVNDGKEERRIRAAARETLKRIAP